MKIGMGKRKNFTKAEAKKLWLVRAICAEAAVKF